MDSLSPIGWGEGVRKHSHCALEDCGCLATLKTSKNQLTVGMSPTYKKKTGKMVARNTAIMELKPLARIMNDAVRLVHADANR